MKKHPDNLRIRFQTGFSLVDVMVGMVIAMLGVIIMFQVFEVSEGIKRRTTSGGDAMQNGAAALYILERSVKQAGYGIFASTNIPPLPADPTTILPLVINQGAANVSDSIVITSRQNWDFGPFPPDPLAYVSAVPPALTMETFAANNFGQLTSTKVYDNPVYNHTTPAAVPATVLSEGIALMKAQYGMDTNGDGVADTWGYALNPTNVKAVRLVVVTRSAQPEKPDPVAGCNTTNVFPTWSGGTVLDLTGKAGLDPLDDWKCYRYKTFEETVALRNK